MSVSRKRRKVAGRGLVELPSTILSQIFASFSAHDWNSLALVSPLLHAESRRMEAAPAEIVITTVPPKKKGRPRKDVFTSTLTRHHPRSIAISGTCEASILLALGNQRRCHELTLSSVDFRLHGLGLAQVFAGLRTLSIKWCEFKDQDTLWSAIKVCTRLRGLDLFQYGIKFPDLVHLPKTLHSLCVSPLEGPFDDEAAVRHLSSLPLRSLELDTGLSSDPMRGEQVHFLLAGLSQLMTLSFRVPHTALPVVPLQIAPTLKSGHFDPSQPLLHRILPHLQTLQIRGSTMMLHLPELPANIKAIDIIDLVYNCMPPAEMIPLVRSFSISYYQIREPVPMVEFPKLVNLTMYDPPAMQGFPVLSSVQKLIVVGGTPSKFIPHIVRCFPNLRTLHLGDCYRRRRNWPQKSGPASLAAIDAMPSLRKWTFSQTYGKPLTAPVLRLLVACKKLRQMLIPKPKDAVHRCILAELRPTCTITWIP